MTQKNSKNNFQDETEATHRSPSSSFRRLAGYFLVLVSGLIFFGWSLHIPALITVRETWPPVAPLAALNFFCIGILLVIMPGPLQRAEVVKEKFILGLSVAVLLTSAMILGRYLLRLETPSIDILVFKDSAKKMGLEYKGLMAPATALNFLLSSFWFIADFAKPRFEILKSVVSLFVLALAMLMLGAYAYGASTLYELPVFLKMSAATATMFLVMGLGLISADPPFGFHWQSPIRFWQDKNTVRERPLYASLLVVFSVFIIAGIATSQSLNRLIGTIQGVTETQAHIQELDRLMMGLLNAESGQRGFLLTGKEEYLDPYFEGVLEYHQAREGLIEWIHQNPQYREPFKAIEDSAAAKLHELSETVRQRRAQGLAVANKAAHSDVGQSAMVNIRERIQFIKNDQLRLLSEQKDENRRQTANTISSITVGSLLATVLLLACLNLYMRNSLKRSRVEEEVRHLNTALEGKLHEIEVVNKELESFSYSVSHDLRAPLRAMAGFSNILVEDYKDKIDEAGRGYLLRIIAASDRMARLIDGILDLSRISRRQVRREDVDLSTIAEQVVAELRAIEPERPAEVLIQPQLKVRGDVDLIGALMQNLLGNAWKFTSKKNFTRIHFGATIKDGLTVFFVRDNGAGFDMAYAEKLFGTFQRLHTEVDFKGTGVGLATVRRIAHLHGGEVWAEGAVNQGATFYFTLGS